MRILILCLALCGCQMTAEQAVRDYELKVQAREAAAEARMDIRAERELAI